MTRFSFLFILILFSYSLFSQELRVEKPCCSLEEVISNLHGESVLIKLALFEGVIYLDSYSILI